LPKKEQNPVEPLRTPLLSSPLCGERDDDDRLRLKARRYSLASVAELRHRLKRQLIATDPLPPWG
jgi:hypothetical protein